ncbi:MAG TPA: hypothetical protein VNO43_17150 [Candidatus Eisenbacteria bacterium]|nr:hypothetical protein [Candidatus Eisenbacteria bacterium]
MRRLLLYVFLTAFFLVGVQGTAQSTPVTFDLVGVEDANLIATVQFSYDAGTAVIDIAISNQSLPSAGPDSRLTALAFNLPDSVVGIASFAVAVDDATAPDRWAVLFDRDGIDTPGRFGFFDIAAITGPNFSGGFPNAGVRPGSTLYLQIALTGSNLELLDESSFLNLFSSQRSGRRKSRENVQYFIGRFQRTGQEGDGSDVAIPNGTPTEPLPDTSIVQ